MEIIGQRLEQGPAGPRLASDTSLRISSVTLVMVLGRPGIPGLTLRLGQDLSSSWGWHGEQGAKASRGPPALCTTLHITRPGPP